MSDGSYPGPVGPSSPPGPVAAAGQQLIGGRNSRPLADARVGINIDTNAISTLKNKLKELTTEAGKLRKEMEGIARASSRISLPGSRGGSGGAYGSQLSSNHSIVEQSAQAAGTAAIASRAMARPTIPVSSATTAGAGGAGGAGAAAAAGGNPYLAAATVALQLYGKAMQAMDTRIARGVSYATSADRTNMLLQQLSGMSQQGVMATNRAPLTRYKLGESPDALLQFGATYGIDMQETMMLGRSIEALRASSGYSKSASSILSSQQQFMSPEVANRMLYMVGTNAYEFGGGLRDPLQMRQEIINRMGLADPNILRGAFTPGSVTRLRMAQAGIGEEAQTEILQYAQQQYQFQQKGGRGFYDPSSRTDRQLMGVENNLANQQEETARLSVAREERFMQKQIDNMTETEKYQQDVVRLLTSMDESLAGIYGARQGYSGAVWKGLETSLVGSAAGDGIRGSVSRSNFVTNKLSAGSSDDANIYIPFGDGSSSISLQQLQQRPDFQSLDSSFRGQLLNLYRANPNIGYGGSMRTADQQAEMFFGRYDPVPANTPGAREWYGTGTWWLPKPGVLGAAPPGFSYHEIGLAVDLYLPEDQKMWLVENSERFGLDNFYTGSGGPEDEAHHVQPLGIPTARVNYDGTESNAIAMYNRYAPMYGHSPISGGSPSASVPSNLVTTRGFSNKSSQGSGRSYSSLTAKNFRAGIGSGFTPSLRTLLSRRSGTNANANGIPGSSVTSSGSLSIPGYSGSGPMTREQVAELLYSVGFTSQDAVANLVAIAGRESSYRPDARRTDNDPSALTGDFGLFQINYSNLSDSFLERIGASSRLDLLNPYYNALAAKLLSNNGTNLFPWNAGPEGWTRDGDPLYGTDIDAARQAVANVPIPSSGAVSLGDPQAMPTRSSSRPSPSYSAGSSGSVNINSSPNITVAPVINFNGMPKSLDLRNIAQTVGRMLKEEVDMLEMRNS